MNYQNQTNNYGYPTMYGGMVYNQGMKVPLFTNPLTQEQMTALRRNANVSSCPPVTETEYLQAICTHRDPSKGTWTIEPYGNDGSYRCTICGDIIRPNDYTPEQVKAITEDFLSAMQSAKMNFVDMSDASVIEFFKMIPLIKRMPAIYEQALNVVNKYDSNNMFTNGGNGNMFQLFSAITNPAMAMNPTMMNYAGMDPMMQQQMMMQQQAAMQQQMMQNGGMGMMPGQVPMSPFYGDPNQLAAMQQQMMQQQMMQQMQAMQQVQAQGNNAQGGQQQTQPQDAQQQAAVVTNVMNV